MRAFSSAHMTDNESKKKSGRKTTVIVMIVVLAVLAVLILTGIYTCPFKAITGLPCPLCGATRAHMAVFRGDIKGAFHFHPLWPLISVTAIAEILNETGLIKIPKKANNIALITVGVLLLICYIYRLVTHTWV